MGLFTKALVAGFVIQALLLLLLYVAGAILPEDDAITDGIHFIIVSLMPAIFFLVVKGYDGPGNAALVLCACIDVLTYTVMILGLFWWRQKQREAGEAEARSLKII